MTWGLISSVTDKAPLVDPNWMYKFLYSVIRDLNRIKIEQNVRKIVKMKGKRS